MTYLTPLHWIVLIIFALIWLLVVMLIVRMQDKSSFFLKILFSMVIVGALAIASLYVLDSYTKIARLENISHKKMLINESFFISGQIINAGNFTIGKCILEVKISNNNLEKLTQSEGPLFVTKSVLGSWFKKQDVENDVPTSKTFVIAQNLYQSEIRNFSVFMRYPPTFSRPSLKYELSCH